MTTWGVQLTTLENRAAEHDRLATEFLTNLADPIKNLAARCEDLRKQHADYAMKLEKERDTTYGELRKQKGKYDTECQDLESRRKKIESSFDSSKNKAQSAYHHQLSNMQNAKVRSACCCAATDTQTDASRRTRTWSAYTWRTSRRNGITTSTFQIFLM